MIHSIKKKLIHMLPSYKKILVCLGLLCIFGISSFQLSRSFATNVPPFYEASQVEDTVTDAEKLEIPTNLISNELESNDSIFAKIRDFFGMGGYVGGPTEKEPALVYVKMIVNRLLGLVSFISLIMIIIAFYMIFFSKQEEAVGKAKKMLIGVAIALVVMGLSRYIVTYFYELFATATTGI